MATDPRTTLARAVQANDRARGKLDQAIKDARTLGVPVAQIARAAGLSRPTVYAILKGASTTASDR